MSQSLTQALLAIVVASFGVISYRVVRRLRSQPALEREVDGAMTPTLHDLERPITKTREHPTFGSAASATARDRSSSRGGLPR